MKGNILDFSIQTNTGIISGDDQNRYNFTGAEWRGQRPPTRGDRVDFGWCFKKYAEKNRLDFDKIGKCK